MRRALIILLTMALSSAILAQEKDFYFFNPKYLKSSLRHEVGMTIGAHWTKSKMLTTYTSVVDGIAYPEPVFNRVIGLMTLTYEPRFRLVQYKSDASISLDIPLTGSLSLVDVLSGSRFRYSAEPLTEAEISSGIYAKERSGILGGLHVETGALLSLNLWQGSTLENTKPVGLTLSGGVNYIYAPLVFNILEDYDRKDYRGFMNWVTPVARLGFHFDRLVLYYMIGVRPTRVYYRTGFTFEEQSVLTNTYNRLSLSIRLGR